ncbi:MAG TPA: hypothetical protein VGW38_15855, partial [Chloroflexota bacterium]|nr:hypothetical protein [Chloroflexota bacterium]
PYGTHVALRVSVLMHQGGAVMNPEFAVWPSPTFSLMEMVADGVLTLAFFAFVPALVAWERRHDASVVHHE